MNSIVDIIDDQMKAKELGFKIEYLYDGPVIVSFGCDNSGFKAVSEGKTLKEALKGMHSYLSYSVRGEK